MYIEASVDKLLTLGNNSDAKNTFIINNYKRETDS